MQQISRRQLGPPAVCAKLTFAAASGKVPQVHAGGNGGLCIGSNTPNRASRWFEIQVFFNELGGPDLSILAPASIEWSGKSLIAFST
jgi:hypothetical protein